MKMTKKLLALALAVLLITALLPSALAAKITVTNNDPDYDTNKHAETYVAYKIFDAVRDANNQEAVTYTMSTSNPFFAVLFDVNSGTAIPKTGNTWFTATKINDTTYVIVPTAGFTTVDKALQAAKWLNANKGSIAGTTLELGDNTVADGYYLITSSLGYNLGLATTDIPMNIVEKNKYPTIDKKQNDDGANEPYSDDVVSVQVGDTIWYQVVVYVPSTADKELTVTDAMSTGITFNYTAGSSFTVKIGENSSTFTTDTTENTQWKVDSTSASGWVIKLDPKKIIDAANPQDRYVEIKFAVTVNESAITESDRKNDVTLTYSNFAQSDSVKYEIYATGAVKYDGATATVGNDNVLTEKTPGTAIKYLAGAEFKLQVGGTDLSVIKDETSGYYRPAKANETPQTIISDSNGEIIIRGLDLDKSYTLVETKAPIGYNLLASGVTLTLSKDEKAAVTISGEANDTTTKLAAANVAKVENNQGSLLPSTGGMGTTLFYVLGSVLVIGAVVLLVSKKRMSKAE